MNRPRKEHEVPLDNDEVRKDLKHALGTAKWLEQMANSVPAKRAHVYAER